MSDLTLTPEELALIHERRHRQAQEAEASKRHREALEGFEPNHVSIDVMSRAGDGFVSIPQTTDAASGATYTRQCALAWRIFGSLVFWDHIVVDFSKPDWALQVKWAVNNITAELVAGYHDA